MKKSITIAICLFLFNCVQDTQPKEITFKVDMRGVENTETIGIRGNMAPLSWQKSMVLTDENNDSIYETTIALNTANYNMEFKFVKNDSVFELDGFGNRTIIFEYQPETIEYIGKFNDPTPMETIKK